MYVPYLHQRSVALGIFRVPDTLEIRYSAQGMEGSREKERERRREGRRETGCERGGR